MSNLIGQNQPFNRPICFIHNCIQEFARDCLRVEKLRVFGEYLCGIDTPLLAYCAESRQYYSVAPPDGYENDDKVVDKEKLSEVSQSCR